MAESEFAEGSAASPAGSDWDEVADVVVVGFGVAGAVTAIEAADHGGAVTVIDRWSKGGASARSGGIIYAGGGTPQQIAAGFVDDPEHMAQYLALEESIAPDDASLRRFCERSRDDLAWLERHGVRFGTRFDPTKSVTPTDDAVGLYFSGNEKHYADRTPAVPRGHRVLGAGMTGRDLVEAMHASARRAGVTVRSHTRLTGLVTDSAGRVVGVEAIALARDPLSRLGHTLLYRLIDASAALGHRVPRRLVEAGTRFERWRGQRVRIGARSGVVLATGGFSYDHGLMVEHAPAFRGTLPLGTPGDDGSGIRLAHGIGAALRSMEHCGASRFIAPPIGFCSGVLVDARGERICDESLYAATLSAHIAEHGSRAWLIVDQATRDEIADQIRRSPRLRDQPLGRLLSGRANAVIFPRVFGTINLRLNRTVAPDLESLADACGLPADRLRTTISRYNDAAADGSRDELGKPAEFVRPLMTPPFSAVPCHLDGIVFPAPCITLGGLDVDATTQQVRRPDGTAIDGLYAVGRCAAGIASASYVSGLSLADCVFSGRNAGQSVGRG
ncbi:MAG TPA: FAD-binding protein [Acidimicrobiales bacterium]